MSKAPQVHTALLADGGSAVMDIRTRRGQWRHLNPTATLLWRQIADGTPLEQALGDLTEHLTAQGADRGTVRADLRALARQLARTGLLTARTSPPLPHQALTVRQPLAAGTPLTAGSRLAALLGVSVALILLRCFPFRTAVGAARTLGRLPRRAATAEEADILFRTIRRTVRFWPGRAACLEESLAVHLTAVIHGMRVTWVLGARTAPAAAHAWVETAGIVIGQHPADRNWPYTPALKV
ncbi:lasso peptide biosynthesis B2 protein [Streptomyces uncialis]|uniref:lasso peptide biosynthesis B2 protein n=1 Tax=Streptomyces uncialis TaxID=1048205 RepID=UPI0036551586